MSCQAVTGCPELPAPGAVPALFDPRPMRFGGAAPGAPACSVVMTVYQDFRFLDAAVNSILAQTFGDFELIVVDDGSAEPGPVEALAAHDPRIRVLLNRANAGAAAAANRGVAAARSDIIVRLDSDDIAEPARLGRLVEALHADPELGLVGSAATLIDEAGRPLGVERMPETDFAIRWTMLFHNPFYHSATAFRRSAFDAAGGYRAGNRIVQDHFLWFDMLPHARARNLAEPLVRYRLNPKGLTATHLEDARAQTDAIRDSLWPLLGLAHDREDRQADLDASGFLRGFGSNVPARRAAAREKILLTLERLLILHPRLIRESERTEAEAFVAGLRDPTAWRRSPLPRTLGRALHLSRTIGPLPTARLAVKRLRGSRG